METMWLAAWVLAASERAVPPGPMTAAAADPDLTLTRTDRGWRIDGRLRRVPWASVVDRVIVIVPGTAGETMLVELDPAAAELQPGQNLAGEPRPDVVCRSLDLPADVVAPAGVEVTTETFLNRAALARVTALAGGCEEVLRLALDQAKDREQFSRPLAKFQAVQQLFGPAGPRPPR